MRPQRGKLPWLVTLAIAGLPLCAAHAHAASHGVAPPSPIVVTFGREGGNMLPLRVTIDATGAVVISAPGRATPSSVRLSPDALDGLRTLAAAEGFATMPLRQIGRGLPDVGGRYVGIRTGSALRVVHARYVHNRAFDQLYAVLSAAVGLPT
jgi:hypothetical protein